MMEKYMQELGYDLDSFIRAGLHSIFSHVYYIWKVLKPELGYEKAMETYGGVWKAIALAQFNQAVKHLGIREVNDIPTLGRIVDYCFSANPCLYETIQNEPDHHIGHILWCPNPAYGPHDCSLSRHEYYRNAEVPLTIDPYLRVMVEEARKMGLNEDIEIAVPTGRCRDGNASCCQVLLWRKGSSKLAPPEIPTSEKRFVEDEIGEEEPITFILRKQGKKLEEFGSEVLVGFIFTDMMVYDNLEKGVGREWGLDLYKKLWLTFPSKWVREARLELEIGRVANIKELAEIILFCERKRFVPYQIIVSGDDQIALVGNNDPFVEIATKILGKKMGDNYFDAVALADEEFTKKILIEAKMSDIAMITAKNRIAKGDDRNEIVIQSK